MIERIGYAEAKRRITENNARLMRGRAYRGRGERWDVAGGTVTRDVAMRLKTELKLTLIRRAIGISAVYGRQETKEGTA